MGPGLKLQSCAPVLSFLLAQISAVCFLPCEVMLCLAARGVLSGSVAERLGGASFLGSGVLAF